MTANYVLLETVTFNNDAATVSVASLPPTGYTDLKIVAQFRTNRANPVDAVGFYLNTDTTSGNYLIKQLNSTGSSAASTTPPYNDEYMFVCGNTATANTYGNSEIYITNYTSGVAKSISIDSVGENNGTTAYANIAAYKWSGTAAINKLTFFPISGTAIMAGSSISVYGIAAVGTTPPLAKAYGGNTIASDGTYWYHAFTTSGIFTPQQTLSCDILQIAGGGGAGGGVGGGGGAGGVLAFATQSVSDITAVTIGAGGLGGWGDGVDGATNGSNSQFAALTASIGGGKGGSINVATTGANGGSGGGGSGSYTFGTGTSGQGSNGATTSNAGGGGGGKGGAGSAGGSSLLGGDGGASVNTVTNWGALSAVFNATGLGYGGYIAGGGAGAGNGGSSGGTGGGGGAGNGGSTTVGGSAVANTGSGGGGGGYEAGGSLSKRGGNGGSGLVIVRYAV